MGAVVITKGLSTLQISKPREIGQLARQRIGRAKVSVAPGPRKMSPVPEQLISVHSRDSLVSAKYYLPGSSLL